jgi:hypothetical protein
MFGDQLVYRVHALQRMFERQIGETDVAHTAKAGDEIESYPNDTPYPSRLLLGFPDGNALHVVAAYNAPADETIIITAYRPDPARWTPDFRTRRHP